MIFGFAVVYHQFLLFFFVYPESCLPLSCVISDKPNSSIDFSIKFLISSLLLKIILPILGDFHIQLDFEK